MLIALQQIGVGELICLFDTGSNYIPQAVFKFMVILLTAGVHHHTSLKKIGFFSLRVGIDHEFLHNRQVLSSEFQPQSSQEVLNYLKLYKNMFGSLAGRCFCFVLFF